MESGGAELESAATREWGNPAALEVVADELRYRTTKAAASLAQRIEARLTELANGGEYARTVGVSGSAAPARPAPPVFYPPPSNVERRYRALRATFTNQAEVLARWGITPLMPVDMRATVLKMWSDRFEAGESHPLGMTSEDLSRDIAEESIHRGPGVIRERR